MNKLARGGVDDPYWYWYWSPYLAFLNMQHEAVNGIVDCPALPKGEFAAHMAKAVGQRADNPFAAMGAMLATAMAPGHRRHGQPESPMSALQWCKLDAPAPTTGAQGAAAARDQVRYEAQRVRMRSEAPGRCGSR